MVLKKKEHNHTPFFCYFSFSSYLSNLKYGTSITICYNDL